MAQDSIGFTGFVLRFAAALALVLLSFNPSGFSYFHWLRDALPDVTPPTVLLGIALLIGWVVFLRATMRSLGIGGVLLAVAFFGVLVWSVAWYGWLSLDDTGVLTWVALVVVAAILSMGLSWSHIRRRLSGQADVDQVDEH
ncbi:MAG: DUF6524 family protein [Steroidobacteraceae bacterium]